LQGFSFQPDGRLQIEALAKRFETVFFEACTGNAGPQKVEYDWYKLILLLLCAHLRLRNEVAQIADLSFALADGLLDINFFAVQAKG
jgi:hypothetical protein